MMDSLVGRTLGQYQIVERIGLGGMATVFKAYQPSLERYVAVKILPPLYAQQPGFSERFMREAKAIARLNHPNILPVYDFDQEGDYAYIVMRYVEAGSLQSLLGQPVDLALTVDIIGQIAMALEAAHRQGIIHRDVKPGNVLLDAGNWALLTDFGLARILEESVQLTGSGVGVGTPAYMSPEQGQGKPVDARSDIYSLGVVLFEMLTGRIPYQAETPLAIVIKRLTEPLPMPRSLNPAIPEPVEQVMLKALAKDQADRFGSAAEMAEKLKAAVPASQVKGIPSGLALRTPVVLNTEIAPPLDRAAAADKATRQTASAGREEEPAKKGPPRRSLSWLVVVAGFVGVLFLVVAGLLALKALPRVTTALRTRQTQQVSTPTPAQKRPAGTPSSSPIVPVPQDTGQKMQLSPTPAVSPLSRTETPSPTPSPSPAQSADTPTVSQTENPQPPDLPPPKGLPDVLGTDDPGRVLPKLKDRLLKSAWVVHDEEVAPSGHSEIFVARVDGSERIQLTKTDDPLPSREPGDRHVGNINPAWSPDGQSIVFASNRDAKDRRGHHSLYIMKADGSDPRRVTDSPTDDRWPSWSPSGNRIVYACDCEVCVINTDGTGMQRLTDRADRCNPAFMQPVWSRDSQRIAFWGQPRANDKPISLYVMAMGQEKPTKVADLPPEVRNLELAWSPDGETLGCIGLSGKEQVLAVDIASGQWKPASKLMVGPWGVRFYPQWLGR